MTRPRRWITLAAAVSLWLLPIAAGAQERIELDVMVSHISNEPGTIDPKGKRLHDKIKKQFRYESLHVLDRKTLPLALNEVGSLRLPNGRVFRVRPMDVGDRGVLMSVSVERTVETDLRAPNRHLVVISGGSYEDGDLVISMEPRY